MEYMRIIVGVLLVVLVLGAMAELDLHLSHGRVVHLLEGGGIEPHYRP
jgi:hypothetical protein